VRRKGPENNRGIAILITITVITLLMTVAMELNRRAQSAVDHTAVSRDRVTLSEMTASAIQVGMALLVKDKADGETVDSLQEEWADPTVIETLLEDIPFEEGKVGLLISDELARIQINALIQFPAGKEYNQQQMLMWQDFLHWARLVAQSEEVEGLDDDDTLPNAIVNSLKDWLDSGDDDAIEGVTGAESNYYQDQEIPYNCQNGPFTHVNEILLVKGFSKLLAALGDFDMVADMITVEGMTDDNGQQYTWPGKININTAGLNVISAMLNDIQKAQDLISYRDEKSDGQYTNQNLSDPGWYKRAPGLSDAKDISALIAVTSDFFRLTATAELHGVILTHTAIVRRQKDKKTKKWVCRVLSWETE